MTPNTTSKTIIIIILHVYERRNNNNKKSRTAKRQRNLLQATQKERNVVLQSVQRAYVQRRALDQEIEK